MGMENMNAGVVAPKRIEVEGKGTELLSLDGIRAFDGLNPEQKVALAKTLVNLRIRYERDLLALINESDVDQPIARVFKIDNKGKLSAHTLNTLNEVAARISYSINYDKTLDGTSKGKLIDYLTNEKSGGFREVMIRLGFRDLDIEAKEAERRTVEDMRRKNEIRDRFAKSGYDMHSKLSVNNKSPSTIIEEVTGAILLKPPTDGSPIPAGFYEFAEFEGQEIFRAMRSIAIANTVDNLEKYSRLAANYFKRRVRERKPGNNMKGPGYKLVETDRSSQFKKNVEATIKSLKESKNISREQLQLSRSQIIDSFLIYSIGDQRKLDSALEEEYGSYKNWKLLSGKSVETLLQELHGVNSLTSTTHNNFVDILNCETVGDMEQLIRDIASEQFVKQSRNNKDAKGADEVTAEQSDTKDDGEELYPQGIELNKSMEIVSKNRNPDDVASSTERRGLAMRYLRAEGDKWKSIVESQLKKDYKSNPRLFVSSLKGKELDTEFKSAVDKLQKRVTTFDTNIEHALKHNDDLFVEREKDRKWKAELLVSKYLWDENGHLKSKGIPGRLFTKLLNDAYDTFLYLGKVDSYSSTNIYYAVAVFKGRWEATRMSMFKSAQSGNLTAKDFVVNLTKFLDEYNALMPKVVSDDAVAKKRRISAEGQFRMKVQVANWTKLVAEDPDTYSEIAKLLPKEKFMNLFALPLGRDIAYERKSYTEVAVLALLNTFREYACGKSTPNMKAEDKTLYDKKIRACDGAFFNEMRIAFVMNGEVTPKTIAEKLDATNIGDTYKRFAMAVSNSNTLLVSLLDKWRKEREALGELFDIKAMRDAGVNEVVKDALFRIKRVTSLDTEATEAYLNLDPLRAVVKQVYGASGVEKLNAVLAEEGVNKGRIADTLTKMQIELNERKALEAERRKIVPEGVKRAVEGVVFEDGEMSPSSVRAITEALKASGVKEGGVKEWQVFARSPLASNKEAIVNHLQTKIFV